MPQRSIGTTNIGVYNPLSQLIDPSADYTLEYVRARTAPFGATAKVSNYNSAAGQYLINIEVRSNDGSWGTAKITFPYSINSTGTSFVGGTNQVYTYGYPYISVTGTPIYPRGFFAWLRDDTSAVVSFVQSLDIYPNSGIMTDGYRLIAQFT